MQDAGRIDGKTTGGDERRMALSISGLIASFQRGLTLECRCSIAIGVGCESGSLEVRRRVLRRAPIAR